MKDTMKKADYLKEHMLWNIVIFIAFLKTGFKCVPEFTYFESILVLVVLALLIMGTGVSIDWKNKNNRNYGNMIQNIICTYGVYVSIAYIDIYKNRILFLVFGAITGSTIAVVMILKKIKYKKRKKRKSVVINVWRRIFSFAFSILLIPLVISVIMHGTFLNPKVKPVRTYNDKDYLEENMKDIAKIEDKHWKKLGVQQKIDISQKIVNCEIKNMGLTHEICVGSADLEEGCLAYYDEKRHQIIINLNYLMKSKGAEVVKSLIHECTHAYQYEQVILYQSMDKKTRNLLLFHDASIYATEFTNYVDGKQEQDFEHYYNQKVEVDARKAGKKGARKYMKMAEKYWQEQQDEL